MKLLSLLFCFVALNCFAQTDTTIKALPLKKTIKKNVQPKPIVIDSSRITAVDTSQFKNVIISDTLVKDSVSSVQNDSITNAFVDTTVYQLLTAFPILNNDKPVVMITAFRSVSLNDYIFYLLIGIVFLLALINIIFPKYLKNIFNVFFQTSFRQVQTKEQLTQENIAALLLNLLFVLSASTYATLIASSFNIVKISFWTIFAVTSISITCIYIAKLLFTQFMGWVFNQKEMAASYRFVVFIVNKIAGIVLIPFSFLVAYSSTTLKEFAFSLSMMLIVFLLFFRFFSTYKNLASRLKINAIHFFLYFCSVEILPLLIMYKVLSNYIGNGI